MEDEETIGAAGTSYADLLGMSQGALNRLGGKDLMEDAIEIAREISPEYKPIDPALLAFQFFTNMAAEASKPGQTALGAASTASLVPAQYLMKDAMAKREAEAKLPATAINIAKAIKPPKATGTGTVSTWTLNKNIPGIGNIGDRVTLTNAAAAQIASQDPAAIVKASTKPLAEKYLQQDRVLYMNEDDARAKLETFGVTEDDPEFTTIFKLMTTDDEELIGRPVIQADQYVSFYIPRAGEDSEFSVITRAPTGSAVPPEVTSRNEEIKKLGKLEIDYIDKTNSLLPTIQVALDTIYQNPGLTGIVQSATLDIRAALQGAFGWSDPEISDQQLLKAISNKLAPLMRPPGSGSTSDMEFKAYKEAVLSLGNNAKANYLTLHMLKKTTENSEADIRLRKELLIQGKSNKYINERIRELDKGIYKKMPPLQTTNVAEFRQARDTFYNSLENGEVFINKNPATGQKLFPQQPTIMIKGWNGGS